MFDAYILYILYIYYIIYYIGRNAIIFPYKQRSGHWKENLPSDTNSFFEMFKLLIILIRPDHPFSSKDKF